MPLNGSLKWRSIDFNRKKALKIYRESWVLDIQTRRSAQNVIDSVDFRLYPSCDTREGRGVGTEDNFGTGKKTIEGRQKAKITRRNTYLLCAASTPAVPRPISPDLAALWLSSRKSPSLSSRSVTAVAALCYRKRCGPGSAATSSTLLTHNLGYVQVAHHWLVNHSTNGGPLLSEAECYKALTMLSTSLSRCFFFFQEE